MIDNEKVKKAIIDWSKNLMYSKIEIDFFDHCGHIGNFSRNEVITFYAGYAARDKESEDEKRELVDALISIVKLHTLPDKTKEIDIAIEAIEKAAGKPIDEVIK